MVLELLFIKLQESASLKYYLCIDWSRFRSSFLAARNTGGLLPLPLDIVGYRSVHVLIEHHYFALMLQIVSVRSQFDELGRPPTINGILWNIASSWDNGVVKHCDIIPNHYIVSLRELIFER
jgi:hypothetical protein